MAEHEAAPPGTNTERITPGPAGHIPQPDPPEGGPNNDEDSPNPADLAPGFGGPGQEQPESDPQDVAGER